MRPLFTAYDGDGPYAFVCYAHADADAIYPDMQWLNEHVCPLWYDEGISGGSVWRDTIADSILGSSLVIFYLTERSQLSEECLKEVGFALDNGIPILCILPEPCEVTPGLKLSLHNRQALERFRYETPAYQVKVSESVQRILSGTAKQPRVDAGAATASRSRYELNEPLVEAGATTIWAGVDRLKRRNVLIKRIPGSSGAGEDLGRQFRTLNRLRHPNLVSAPDFGIDADGSEYLVLDLPDLGITLSSALRDATRHRQLELIAQALRALHQIHGRGYGPIGLNDRSFVVHEDRLRLVPLGDCMLREIEGPEVRSALRALGLILLAGFDEDFGNTELTEFQAGAAVPDLKGRGLDDDLRGLLEGLINAQGGYGYDAASEALTGLQAVGGDLLVETALTRESTLQTADFVGRDAELDQLDRALESARRGHGQTILVGGESGVGKSRLIAELETNARLRGIHVMRGIAADGDTGSYKLWEEVVRHLMILCRADSEPRVALDDNSFLAIEQLLVDQSAPAMIILEDIHWAGSESLKLLSWLARPVLSLPIVIVGTFRDNEGFDPDVLGVDVKTLHLTRLGEGDVGRLAATVLGYEPDEALLEFLTRETEGNSLFIVETLRVLAEEAGSLADIRRSELPESVLSGGMRRILRRRVRRLGDSDLPALRVAALIGRSVDPELMGILVPDLDLEAWAHRCMAEAVLEQDGQYYRFSHDKIREFLISDFEPQERRVLHSQIAEALEQIGSESFALLTHHWAEAGDSEREAKSALVAGRASLGSGALREAVELFERSGSLLANGAQIDVQRLDAVAAVEAGLSDGYYRLGNLAECTQHSLSLLEAVGEVVPRSAMGRASRILGSMLFSSGGPASPDDDRELEASRAYLRLTDVYFYSLDQLGAVWSTLRAVRLSKAGNCTKELAQSYALMGALAAAANLKGLGRSYAKQALMTCKSTTDDKDRIGVFTRLAVQSLSDCDWTRARRRAEIALGLAERHGDLRLVEESSTLLALTDMLPGRFARSAPQFAKVRDLALRSGDRQLDCWGAQGEAISLIRLGRSDEARELVSATVDVVHDPYMRIESINTHAILAVCDFRSGEIGRAQSYVELVVNLLADTPPMAYWLHSGVSFLLEALYALSEQRDSAELAKLRKRALKCLDTFASSQRLGLPLKFLYHGIELARAGKSAKAAALFDKGIDHATELNMRYEQTVIRMERAKLEAAAVSEELRRDFEEMGCRYELEQLAHG